VQQVIEAHGGVARWNAVEALEADISAWGMLFTMKRRPRLNHVRVRASAREPRLTFREFPSPGQTSELIGNEEVRIVDSAGRVVARRADPRSAFRSIRRQLFWDDLDFVYFGGYATWNYLVTPFLFLRPGFEFEELMPIQSPLSSWSRLQVTFPRDVPTHCQKQIFYFDERRYLRRIDYTAEVVGRWARAAHHCGDYNDFDGFKAPTQRRVRPLLWGSQPLPGPTLVGLEVHNIRPLRAG